MQPILIVGIGSPFGDDSIGWQVAGRLQQHPCMQNLIPRNVQIEFLDRPGVELLNVINQVGTAIIIDAAQSNEPPGTIIRLESEEAIDEKNSLSSHSFGVLETLALGKAIQQLPERVIVYGVVVGTSDTVNENGCGDAFNITDFWIEELVEMIMGDVR